MLKIIVPLAGSSELFNNAGYYYPKPLIEINGKIMIEWVLQNPAQITEPFKFIFIISEEDASKFHLDNTLKLVAHNCEVIKLKKPAKGGLCSVLMAVDKINADDSILILNGDQFIDMDFNWACNYWKTEKIDAGIVTFNSIHPRWSYARLEDDAVVQTAEKKPISYHAIAGYYYFKVAQDFFKAAFESIKNDVQIDGNFYISPVLNQYVLQNKVVKHLSISNESYHSFYSPKMVMDFERKKIGLNG
jgi:NDP-sugar pyrophosphorylase family protein